MRGGIIALLLLLAPRSSLAEEIVYHSPSGLTVYGILLGEAAAQKPQARAVLDMLKNRLKLDASRVPIFVVNNSELKQLHRAVGGQLRSNFHLDGFQINGHVFVREMLVVQTSVLLHETLHAMAEPFNREAQRRGSNNLVEGLTQFFTSELMRSELRANQRDRHYVNYTAFGKALAETIGHDRLRDDFFHRGYAALERDVDAKLGAGTLRKASTFLEREDFWRAMAALGR